MKINKKIIVAMCLVSILSVGCGSINEENKSIYLKLIDLVYATSFRVGYDCVIRPFAILVCSYEL